MTKKLQHWFALSEKGAQDLVKAVFWCFVCNLSLMLPVGAVMLTIQHLLTVLEEGEDLCGLYLQVLNDLWADALGGESGVETIGVDASALEGLSEGEADAMAYAFGMAHQTGLPLRGTFDELTEQGYIEPAGDGPGRWPGGALFRLEGSADTGFQVCCWMVRK